MKQLEDNQYEAMKSIVNIYQGTYKPLEKMELTPKEIFALRRKIKQEKREGYDNYLRTITLYTHYQDPTLKLFINKLYLEYFNGN